MTTKKTKRKLKLLLSVLLVSLLSLSVGFALNDYYYSGKSSTGIYIKDYLETGRFKEVKVVIYSEGELTDEFNENLLAESNGFYSTSKKTIYLNENKLTYTGKDFFRLYHEYGHYIYYEVIDDEEREEYQEIFEESEYFVRTYGIEDGVYEDFADTYAMYLINRDKIETIKYNYFNRLNQRYPVEI